MNPLPPPQTHRIIYAARFVWVSEDFRNNQLMTLAVQWSGPDRENTCFLTDGVSGNSLGVLFLGLLSLLNIPLKLSFLEFLFRQAFRSEQDRQNRQEQKESS